MLPPPPPQQAPYPSHEIQNDPNAFRQFFRQELQALTFNSKPIITNLTILVHENTVRMSGVVASVLEEQLQRVSFIQRFFFSFWLLHLFLRLDLFYEGTEKSVGSLLIA